MSTARLLATASSNRPSQANLRRAISTAYYALFHTLAKSGADLLVGGPNSVRSKHAWRQVYRALEHGFTKNACRNSEIVTKFPKEIEDFANMFVTMQIKRHEADYDPYKIYTKSEVQQDIDSVESVLHKFRSTNPKDRKAFSVHVLLKTRNDYN